MALSEGTGLAPSVALAHGLPSIAVARNTSADRLLQECGISMADAVRAGLHLPQPEFLTNDPAVCCLCARDSYGRGPNLGALVLGGIFDDVLAPFGIGGAASSPYPSATGEGGTVVQQYDPGPAPIAPSMTDGWPAAPGFRPGNWDFDAPNYTIATGDTLSGLARLYLGAPNRWPEIWSLQSYRWTLKPDPSSHNPGRGIQQGDILVMPYEARDMAVKLMKTKPATPASPGAPGTKPNAVNGLSPTAPGAANFVAQHKTGLIVAGVALVGIVGYAALR
jgi:hypothetical protein